jgi:hypothetical protein
MWWWLWWMEMSRMWTEASMQACVHAGTGVYGPPRRRLTEAQTEYMVRELREDLDVLGIEGLRRGE